MFLLRKFLTESENIHTNPIQVKLIGVKWLCFTPNKRRIKIIWMFLLRTVCTESTHAVQVIVNNAKISYIFFFFDFFFLNKIYFVIYLLFLALAFHIMFFGGKHYVKNLGIIPTMLLQNMGLFQKSEKPLLSP